jgi:hypothetical protein
MTFGTKPAPAEEGKKTDTEFNETNEAENRSGDFGEAGEFAPGGYYNQRGATKPERIDLEDELAPRQHQTGNRR